LAQTGEKACRIIYGRYFTATPRKLIILLHRNLFSKTLQLFIPFWRKKMAGFFKEKLYKI
jgi:hypothetical protein